MLALIRLRYDDQPPADTIAELARILDALRGCTGFRDGAVGRALDDERLWVLHSSWQSVGGYRRALSSYPVKLAMAVVQARVVDEPSAYEVLSGAGGLEPDPGKPNESRPRGAVT